MDLPHSWLFLLTVSYAPSNFVCRPTIAPLATSGCTPAEVGAISTVPLQPSLSRAKKRARVPN
jgi:hypothetical protein